MSNQREDGLAPSPSSSSSYPVMSSTGNGPAGSSNGGSVNESIMDETAASLAAGLTSDAKNLINSLLGTRGGESGARDQNLQILSMAAAANSSQKPPPAKNTSSSPAPGPVTTPTQVTPVSTRKRGRLPVADHDDSVKRRKCAPSSGGGRGAPTSEKQSKGLRHFSQLVCEKVREKGRTTYNEVADELVKEFGEAERRSGQDGQIDQKNIRRRVYDALNVLMAMNIINKEKKDIHWIGLPTNSVQECEHIQMELSQQEERISKKTSELHDLVLQILTLKNLIKRNRDKAAAGESPSQNSAIGLPFILVNTNKNTTIDCSISSDKSEYVFTFDNTFELHQDVDILNKMDLDCGLNSGKVSTRSIAEAKATLPKIFEPVIDDMAVLSRTIPQSPPAATLFEPPPPVSVAATPTSTQSSIQPPSLPTPLLSDHSNGSFSNLSASSPLAIAAAALVNSHNPVSVAAAITQLQQLQQASSLPPTTSPSSSSFLRGGTVTARPLNFTSSPRPQSSPGLLGVKGHSSQSPKVVTVQPLPNSVTSKMAEVIASLQSSILMQQQQQYAMGGAATPLNSAQSENVIPSIASLSDELPSSKTQGGGVTATIDESEQVSTSSVLTPSNPPVSLST
ncbi:PREDICTED: transcription factor Dp-2-like [Amphimedon queenslandica]|uniref:E2F/DP family winged-helix DNA-binding domain-containing protein n=1 Tax=Amphimedon queenslandica TaxID=400682 RepID=A0A1X7VUM9_AMPQE|nr:PREDICTED: transcription factor Dp-2-like [Amphimedon queenslandica]|eukprot:XP_003382748.1 PREDICTED: transcription factor Dp-2-like [Amphimedon queenslandica]